MRKPELDKVHSVRIICAARRNSPNRPGMTRKVTSGDGGTAAIVKWPQLRRPFEACFPTWSGWGTGLLERNGWARTLARSMLALPLSFVCSMLSLLLGEFLFISSRRSYSILGSLALLQFVLGLFWTVSKVIVVELDHCFEIQNLLRYDTALVYPESLVR